MGGLICERRNSESAVPKEQTPQLKSVTTDDTNDYEGFIYSNECVLFANNRFEYVDCANSCVGHGSFGTVFKGIDRMISKPVAIKRIPTYNVKPNELKAMQRVSSDFLVSLIEICNENTPITHIVMELCDIDLEQHLLCNTDSGKLVESDFRILINNIACGYYALFQQHIVHRDIKPQNILIQIGTNSQIKNAKITDFGVSRIVNDEDNQTLNNVAGTLYYMAPEVGANLLTICEYDHSVDIWSIGCVFYQSYVGKIPFDECALCRLFLYCAGNNYYAYDFPELPEDTPMDVQSLLTSLLEIDRDKRATPQQLYESVKI